MNVAYFLTTLGLVPYFATRAFLPLFLTALAVRFGSHWSFLHGALGVAPAADLPPWATSNVSLWALGVGALVEGVLQRDPDLRRHLALTDSQLKTVLAVGLCLVLAPETEARSTDAATLAWLGAPQGRYAWALGIGFLVWWSAHNRRRFFSWLSSLDEDDDFGTARLLAWLEEGFSLMGTLVVFLLPVFAAGAALAAVGCAGLVARRLGRAGTTLGACPACGNPLHPCAPHCPRCRAVIPSPRAVGLFGRPLEAAAGADHQQRLLASKRCRFCAARLTGNGVDMKCSECGSAPFTSRLSVDAYLSQLSRRTAPLLLVLAAFGAIPVFGLFAGILLYRVALVAPIRQYTPLSARLVGRWLLRGVNALLLLLQPIPLLGIVVLPLMALANVWYYTRRLTRAAERILRAKDYSETLKR